ncbi:MAG: T9SS type A sorting domain-containing protein, partial [bacterium]
MQGYDSLGNAMEVDAVWNATGGNIDSTGLYTAGSAPGNYEVTAEEPISHIQATAALKIEPMLARIVVSPDTAVLATEKSQQFTAQGFDSLGNTVQVFTLWQATGGEIDATGLYTAGLNLGFYKVFAEDSRNHLLSSAVVHIKTVTEVVQQESPVLPEDFVLMQNYPNPFNPSTTIEFGVKKASHVKLTIYDLRGRKVTTLLDKFHQPGFYKVTFEASELATGVYFYQIQMGQFQAV